MYRNDLEILLLYVVAIILSAPHNLIAIYVLDLCSDALGVCMYLLFTC